MTTNDTRTQLEEERRIIDAASDGPWKSSVGADPDGNYVATNAADKEEFLCLALNGDGEPLSLVENGDVIPAVTGDGPSARANAEFIAHARTALPQRITQLAAVLELHAPETFWAISDWDRTFDSYDDALEYLDGDMDPSKIESFQICKGCRVVEDGPCDGECTMESGYREALYPCSTVRAIEAATE